MKIAVNTRYLVPDQLSGYAVYTHEIMSRMVRQHPEDAFVFYYDRKLPSNYIYGENVRASWIFPPARDPWLFRVWYHIRVRQALNRDKPDVFFSPDGFMPLKCPVPAVITVHDVAHRRFPDQVPSRILKYYNTYLPKYLEHTGRVITVSNSSKKEICKWYDIHPDKVKVVYNGVSSRYKPLSNEDVAAQREQWSDGRPYLLFVGMIHPRKNIDNLIRAYDKFRETSSLDYPMLIAGSKHWQYEAVDQAWRQSAFKQDIRFLGFVPNDELPKLTGGARLLCYISLYEGFGLPVLEAMACGVPVLCSDRGSIAEVAGDAARLVNPGDEEAIGAAIREILEDPDSLDRLSRLGRERAMQFSWDRAAEETYAVLNEVL